MSVGAAWAWKLGRTVNRGGEEGTVTDSPFDCSFIAIVADAKNSHQK